MGLQRRRGADDGVVNVEGTDEQQKVGKAGEERGLIINYRGPEFGRNEESSSGPPA